MSQRAVFLDRDGVINAYVYSPEFGTVDSPSNPGEFLLLPGVPQAITSLNRLGLSVIVVSNQPGVAKGKLTREVLASMTEKMVEGIKREGGRIDEVYYCLHHPEATVPEYRLHCDCRKPSPGLFLKAAREKNISLPQSYVVGDGIADILAGRAAGTTTFFLSPRKCYVCDELARNGAKPDYFVGSLDEAAETISGIVTGQISPVAQKFVPGCGLDPAADYAAQYLTEAMEILKRLNPREIEKTLDLLVELRRRNGRLFFLGVGGGAGHASHAVNDFRKIAGIEAYTPTDNVSELTARINDDGWETAYTDWLRGSRLKATDMVFVFSVGGGDAERNISANLVRALQYAKEMGASICGVVGRNGGFTAQLADACILIPVVNAATVTPHTESFQALVWHLLVSHPKLKASEMKWESVR